MFATAETQVGDHGCGSLDAATTDRSVFNSMIYVEPGRKNGEMSFFQINPGSAYNIKMVASVFGGIACTYTFGVLRPKALSFIRALRNPTFQQDNSQPHVVGIVQTFSDTENVQLLPWPACSPDLSPIKNVRSMGAERLARHHTPVTTFDELWHHVEAA
ncbi:uncharacterized protein TNCV_4252491 [Trichonephila clavipes]|nr:uncharacterized protein TNCV_4252491 [Trichonephila clavipes]